MELTSFGTRAIMECWHHIDYYGLVNLSHEPKCFSNFEDAGSLNRDLRNLLGISFSSRIMNSDSFFINERKLKK